MLNIKTSENSSDPWYSKEGDGRKNQESIRESYCDRNSKDMHSGICANPPKGNYCLNRTIYLSD